MIRKALKMTNVQHIRQDRQLIYNGGMFLESLGTTINIIRYDHPTQQHQGEEIPSMRNSVNGKLIRTPVMHQI